MKLKSPEWKRSELILAFDLYNQLKPSVFRDTDPRIVELSEVLCILSQIQFQDLSHARNPGSVKDKLNDWDRKDPKTRERLNGNCKADRDIWLEFADDISSLAFAASAIRAEMAEIKERSPTEMSDEETPTSPENLIFYRWHRKRERSSQITRMKKKAALNEVGRLECEVCHFDFHSFYGEHGYAFIECHHILPLSKLYGPTLTSIEELALVCSNCHRMLHRGDSWPSVTELREKIQQTSLLRLSQTPW